MQYAVIGKRLVGNRTEKDRGEDVLTGFEILAVAAVIGGVAKFEHPAICRRDLYVDKNKRSLVFGVRPHSAFPYPCLPLRHDRWLTDKGVKVRVKRKEESEIERVKRGKQSTHSAQQIIHFPRHATRPRRDMLSRHARHLDLCVLALDIDEAFVEEVEIVNRGEGV